jgi:hypothetical protein
MEPMVVCALGIVLYFGYLTVRDILNDLQREGVLVSRSIKKTTAIPSMRIMVSSGRFQRIGGLIGADFGLLTSSNSPGRFSGNVWAGGVIGGCYGYDISGRRSRG